MIDDLQKKLKFEKELNLRPTWLELGLVQVCGRYKLMVYLIQRNIFDRSKGRILSKLSRRGRRSK